MSAKSQKNTSTYIMVTATKFNILRKGVCGDQMKKISLTKTAPIQDLYMRLVPLFVLDLELWSFEMAAHSN